MNALDLGMALADRKCRGDRRGAGMRGKGVLRGDRKGEGMREKHMLLCAGSCIGLRCVGRHAAGSNYIQL